MDVQCTMVIRRVFIPLIGAKRRVLIPVIVEQRVVFWPGWRVDGIHRSSCLTIVPPTGLEPKQQIIYFNNSKFWNISE